MTLVFLDTETTGLDPDRHEVWEIAFAVDDGPIVSGVVPHSLRNADPLALNLNGYYGRGVVPTYSDIEGMARSALEGASIVGANPAFDAAFLRARWGCTPWHHRLWDVEAFAAGVLGLDFVPGLAKTAEILRVQGYEIPEPDHTAAGDVATLRTIFRHLMKGPTR